ncbi:MAG: DUF4249 family protein [Calditrichaeota bacterium]|nr:MAG: DUF4249 family protein [Calditrichota bacterium]
MTNKIQINLLLLLTAILMASCGNPSVTFDKNDYEPQIVFDAYIFANEPITRIGIRRNFPLNSNISILELLLPTADVKLTDENGNDYQLTFNDSTWYHEYLGTDLVIETGKSYTLSATAEIDGQTVSASSTTTLPEAGFNIAELRKLFPNGNTVATDSITYREKDENDEPILLNVKYNRSPGTTFYAFSYEALNADSANYIYDNPFTDEKPEDVQFDLEDWQYQWDWIQNTPKDAGTSDSDIQWFSTWFYGEYEVNMYAADKNFGDYMSTHTEVQEPDGNFHEAKFHIEGDGIGIFGSAIREKFYFTVLP